jgi:hypothetical protein
LSFDACRTLVYSQDLKPDQINLDELAEQIHSVVVRFGSTRGVVVPPLQHLLDHQGPLQVLTGVIAATLGPEGQLTDATSPYTENGVLEWRNYPLALASTLLVNVRRCKASITNDPARTFVLVTRKGDKAQARVLSLTVGGGQAALLRDVGSGKSTEDFQNHTYKAHCIVQAVCLSYRGPCTFAASDDARCAGATSPRSPATRPDVTKKRRRLAVSKAAPDEGSYGKTKLKLARIDAQLKCLRSDFDAAKAANDAVIARRDFDASLQRGGESLVRAESELPMDVTTGWELPMDAETRESLRIFYANEHLPDGTSSQEEDSTPTGKLEAQPGPARGDDVVPEHAKLAASLRRGGESLADRCRVGTPDGRRDQGSPSNLLRK